MRKTYGMRYHFMVLPVEDGYRLRVNCAGTEYLWPDVYPTLEKVGEVILQALTTASESRGEIGKRV